MNEGNHDVFISYSRQESSFAGLLERKLEAYKPPKGLGLPTRRLRAFLDTSDIRGEDYDQTIARELAQSRNLIVLCSPAARASHFVDDEIRRFAVAHKEENEKLSIVPILVDGIPNNEASKPEDEKLKAFPEALYEIAKMPLAQDFRQFTLKRNKFNSGRYRNAWFATLATLLGVERDDLEERDRRRAARQRNIILAIGLAIIASLSLLTLYAFRAQRIATEQERIATEQRDLAEERLKVSQARELAARSSFLQARKSYLTRPAMLLAIESLRKYPTPQGTTALQSGLSLLLQPGLNIPASSVESVLFTPDGKSLIVARLGGTITFHSLASGKEYLKIHHRRGIKAASLSFDGKILATAGRDKTARLWNVSTGKEIAALHHEDYIDYVAFGPEDKRLITAGQRKPKIVIWKIAGKLIEGEYEMKSRGYARRDISAIMSPDGRWLVATGNGRDAFIWDMKSSGQPIVLHHDNVVYASVFTPQGDRLITGGEGQKARVWRVDDWTQEREMQHDTGFGEGTIYDLSVSSDGRLLATVLTRSQQVGAPSMFGAVGLARVWEIDTGREVGWIEHNSAAKTVRFAPSGHKLAVGGKKSVRLWSAEPGHAMWPIGQEDRKEDSNFVRHLAISHNGNWIASTRGQTALLWESHSGHEKTRLKVEDQYAGDIVFGRSDNILAIATRGGAFIWDWAHNTLRKLSQPDAYVSNIAFSSDDRILAAANLKAFWSWEVEKTEVIHTHAYEEEKDHSLALSPNGKRYAIAGGRIYMDQGSPAKARVWEVETGKLLQTFNYKGVAGTMAFDDDATRLVTGGEGGNVRVWDIETGEITVHVTHDDSINAVAFSHDSKWIAAAGREGTLRVWEVETQREISRFDLRQSPSALLFSPDNRTLWIGTQSGTIHQRMWHPNDIIEAACKRLLKNFTVAEWREYMSDGPNSRICDELPIEASSYEDLK